MPVGDMMVVVYQLDSYLRILFPSPDVSQSAVPVGDLICVDKLMPLYVRGAFRARVPVGVCHCICAHVRVYAIYEWLCHL